MTCAIIVPTIRGKELSGFLAAWHTHADHIFVMLDVAFDGDKSGIGRYDNVTYITHDMVRNEPRLFASGTCIIPEFTDCCRSYAILKAYEEGYDEIWSLDDDVRPMDSEAYGVALHHKMTEPLRWFNTAKLPMRGLPYGPPRERESWLHMGTWRGVPDFDGVFGLLAINRDIGKAEPLEVDTLASKGAYFPMCGMNVRWRRELTPLMYQLLMGRHYPFDRFGDIWSGVFMKKICDHLDIPVSCGGRMVKHERASDPYTNLQKEAPGLEVNEELWRKVDAITLTETNPAMCYGELATHVSGWDICGHEDYWRKLGSSMLAWSLLFERGAV